MKTYRDHARERRGIAEPQMIVPVTAHAAFDKAASTSASLVHVPVATAGRADDGRRAHRTTVVVVGSSPSFPHGVIDPIEELSELAAERGIGFHTDACLGGFVLPWAERLGYPVPAFDFRLPGVTSMSADTHKYGYAAKGTSVVLYRGRELRHFQYFTITDWPGGLYMSPTFAGSRPGALSAACWAAMVSIGEERLPRRDPAHPRGGGEDPGRRRGHRGAARPRRPAVRHRVRRPTTALDVFRVIDAMSRRGWSLNGLHRPAALHLCVDPAPHPGGGGRALPRRPVRIGRGGPGQIPVSAPGWPRSTAWPPPCPPMSSARCSTATSTCFSTCRPRSWTRERHVLCIDLGTSALKVALVSMAGEVVASEEETHRVTLLPGGGAEQDPRHWWI